MLAHYKFRKFWWGSVGGTTNDIQKRKCVQERHLALPVDIEILIRVQPMDRPNLSQGSGYRFYK